MKDIIVVNFGVISLYPREFPLISGVKTQKAPS
jgi:hypothetical protein